MRTFLPAMLIKAEIYINLRTSGLHALTL